jgi:hypothetical protein
MEIVKKTKKIGLLIHSGASMFSNGIVQNAYFMYQCFNSLGMKCELLAHDDEPSPLDYKKIPLRRFSTNPLYFDPSEYHTIITITRGMDKDTHALLKSHNVAVVGFVCGNNLMHDMEDFVRGNRDNASTFIGKGSVVDELWVIPSYHHSLDYLEIIRGKPAFIVPHLWSPEICRTFAADKFKKTEVDLLYNIAKHTNKKIDIVIMEPNFALFKTAWIPIVASERLHLDYPELVGEVFAFNFPESNHAWGMADNFTLGKKLRRFKRLSMPEILSYFNDRNTIPIFVSHQIQNSLNYLYYELLYYGYPLVHNSPDLDGCGYFYPENNIKACVAGILDAYKNHSKHVLTHRENALKYLERVDPLHPSVGKKWEQMINSVLVKNIPAVSP